jgi:hypothetical protein
MANKKPLVIDANGEQQQLQPGDILQVEGLIMGPPGAQAESTTFNNGNCFWLNLPNTGSSGIGTGGPGNDAWLGYCFTPGDWHTDSANGDLSFRNLAGRLLFGTSTGNSHMAISANGIDITSNARALTVPNTDNSTNIATTAFAQSLVAAALASIYLQRFSGNVAVTSGTSQIPYGNNAPLITAGTQLWSQTITPSKTTNSVNIKFTGMIDSSYSNNNITVAVFRGNTLVGFITKNIATSNRPGTFSLSIKDSPGVNTAVTYTCRIGCSYAATWYLGRGASATMGGVNNSGWTLEETF